MDWILITEIIYIIFIIAVCLRIIYDTNSVTKTLGYLLLVIFLPIIGVFIYFSFGINYRKNKLYSKKIIDDHLQEKLILQRIETYNSETLKELGSGNDFERVSRMIYRSDISPLTKGNDVKLLINGEQKFPEVFEALKKAQHHIHIEYYIYEDDDTGREIEKILIEKAKSGVEVRFIYDDFGSASIRKRLVKRLKENGVKAYPFYKIKLLALANRLNYRNHRKIIVIDGKVSFVGGINISNKYSNNFKENTYYWRDTHLKISGTATAFLQQIFIGDWNFCSGEKISIKEEYFPKHQNNTNENKFVQIVSSGPDSDRPSIYYSIIQTILSAKEEVLLTSPYFIPGETIMDALIMASLSGIKVKLLVPGISDSFFVNAAAKSYYNDLLKAGVEIYLYNKGFVHAKTLVADRLLCIVGTANMDYRSFDLNFEVNAVVYDENTSQQLAENFDKDITVSEKIDHKEWLKRPKHTQLVEKVIRLVSPLL
ncbi:MAG: cardiolipin synthase [Cloacibacterium sp.]|jgi:cardiolipin synthase|nr:cardiolipin synthase [Cloacibacterium sp.]